MVCAEVLQDGQVPIEYAGEQSPGETAPQVDVYLALEDVEVDETGTVLEEDEVAETESR